MNIHGYLCSINMHEIILGVDNCGKSCIRFCMSVELSPLVHEYSWLFIFSIFKHIHGAILHSCIIMNIPGTRLE